MEKITEKEILLPVTVLWDGCKDCDRLDIHVSQQKLYADGEKVGTENRLYCSSLHECKRYAEMVARMMDNGR